MAVRAHENTLVCFVSYDYPRSSISLITDTKTLSSCINVMKIKRTDILLITADLTLTTLIGNGKFLDLTPSFGNCLYKISGTVSIYPLLDSWHRFEASVSQSLALPLSYAGI